jgi:hypothetical protein
MWIQSVNQWPADVALSLTATFWIAKWIADALQRLLSVNGCDTISQGIIIVIIIIIIIIIINVKRLIN